MSTTDGGRYVRDGAGAGPFENLELWNAASGGLSFGSDPLKGGLYLMSRDGSLLLRTHPVNLLGGWIVKRRKANEPAEGKAVPTHRAPMETQLFQKLPNVMAHLAVNRLDDGSPRRPGSVIVMSSGSGYRLIAKEPDESLELEAYGETIDDAFAMLELLLGTDDCPWQPEREWRGKGAQKKKT